MKKILCFFGFLPFLFPQTLFAQTPAVTQNETVLKGTVTQVLATEKYTVYDKQHIIQELEVEITSGDEKGLKRTITTTRFLQTDESLYQIGDTLLIGRITDTNTDSYYYILGFNRSIPLLLLFLLFLITTLFVTRWKGVRALLGLLISFLLILYVLLPAIKNGYDPLAISLLGIVLLVPVLFYLTHGISKKTHVAIAGTILSLIFCVILSHIAISSSRFTGLTVEQLETLLFLSDINIHVTSLLTAGIIIGALGVLDDVSITQVSVVSELSKSSGKKRSIKQLYETAMEVGRDHIGSVVNTLILVYTGASLPFLILSARFPRPLSAIVSDEQITLSIITALVSTIGIMIAIPLTTLVASYVFSRK